MRLAVGIRHALRLAIMLALAALVSGLALLMDVANAQEPRLQYGDRVSGEIAAGSAPDVWRFDGGAGDRVTVRLERLDGDAALALRVRDSTGAVALEVAWPGSDEPVSEATLRLASGGEHAIEISAGQGAGTYALSLILAQPGSATGRADIALSYGQTIEGELLDAAAVDAWSFRGEAGDVIDVTLASLNLASRPRVALVSPTGTTLASGTDLLAVRLPMGGTYTLDVRLVDGPTGAYRLALRLRSSPLVDTEFLAAPLDVGATVSGRLTSDAPAALYRVTGSGTLALALDLADADTRADVAVLTENRAVLGTLSGFGQIRAPISFGGQGSLLLEITSPDAAVTGPVDFALRTGALRRAGRNARPLIPGLEQRVAPGAEPVTWFLDARAGDMIELSVTPDAQSPDGQVQLYNPQGDVLLQWRIDAGFRQELLVEQTGLMEIAIQPGGEGYAIGAVQTGAAGIPFDLVVDRVERGPLGAGGAPETASEVAPHAADVWTVDIPAAGTWALDLAAPGDGLLALRLESPDGAAIAQAVTQPVSGQAALEGRIETPGRYRIVALNPGESALAYTLRASPSGGGDLASGDLARGVLLAAQPEHRWTFAVSAPASVRVELSDLAGVGLPDAALVGPDGRLAPLAPVSAAAPGVLVAQVTESGTYALRVRLPQPLASLPYGAHVTIESGQNTPAPVIAPGRQDTLIATPEPAAAPVRLDPLAQILPATRPGPDVLENAPLLAFDTTVRGTIPPGEHYQIWRFQGLADQRIALAAVGLAQGTAPDLTLLDEQGEVLARSLAPDRTGNRLTHRFAADGRYFVVVRYVPGARYLLRAQDRSALDDTLSAVLPGRVIAVGETVRGELLREDAVEHAYFYAHTGDALRAQAVRQMGTGGIALHLERVEGAVLVEGQADPAHPERATLDFTVATQGVYRLSIQPDGEAFAPGEFALHLALTGSPASTRDGLRLDAEGVGTLASDNLTDTWLFSALAGEHVSIIVEAGNDGPQPLVVELADTAGTPFLRQESIVGAPVITLDDISLPRTGVYRLVIGAGPGERGPYRVRLARDTRYMSDAQHPLPLNETVSRVLTGTNTLDVWTFAGTEGDVISADVRAIRGDTGLLSFQIRTQNGAVLASVAGDASGRAAVPQILLPETGHYTLAVGNLSPEFQGVLAYELTVLLESTQARSMGALLAPGNRGAGTLSGADRRDVWLFEGRQGDIARIELSAEGGGVAASVLTTDWHIASTSGTPSMLVVGDQDGAGTLILDPVVLPADGVYTIDVSAAPGGTTNYTVSLEIESDSALSAAPVDLPVQVEGRVSAESFREAWTFEAHQGDAVSLRVVPDSRATLVPQLTLYAPGGYALVSALAESGAEVRLDSYALPESGVYTVAVSRRLGTFGGTEGRFRLEMALEPAPEVATRLLRYEQIGQSWINNTSPVEHWIFEGEAGDVIEARLDVRSGTLDPLLRLYGPDGALIAASEQGNDGAPQLRYRLGETGSYRIEVERRGGASGLTQGNYALALNRLYRFAPLPGAVQGIAYGERVTGTVDDESPLNRWVFAGAAGDLVRASVHFPTDDAALTLSLTDPSGVALAEGTRASGRTTIDGLALPYSGVYVLEVRRTPDARSSFSPYELGLALSGSSQATGAAGGLLEPGQPVYGRFESAPQAHVWLLRASRDDRLALSLARLEGALAADLTLLAPDGTVLLETAAAPGAAALTTEPLTLEDAGLYAVVVSARDGAAGFSYRLHAAPLDLAPETLAE